MARRQRDAQRSKVQKALSRAKKKLPMRQVFADDLREMIRRESLKSGHIAKLANKERPEAVNPPTVAEAKVNSWRVNQNDRHFEARIAISTQGLHPLEAYLVIALTATMRYRQHEAFHGRETISRYLKLVRRRLGQEVAAVVKDEFIAQKVKTRRGGQRVMTEQQKVEVRDRLQKAKKAAKHRRIDSALAAKFPTNGGDVVF